MTSLRGRLILTAAAIMVASGLAAGLGGYRAARLEADELLDAQLARIADTVLFLVESDRFDSAGDIGLGDRSGHSQFVYRVWRLRAPAGGSIAWSSEAIERPYPRLVLRAGAIDWPAGQLPDGYHSLTLAGAGFRFLARTSNRGDYRVEVGEDLIDRAELIREIAWHNTWPYLVALPLGIALLAWSIHRVLAPVRRLAAELGDRDPEHLDRLAITGLPSELEPVLAALNNLLDQLHRALESERRFTGDAAHELRTPMAALGAQLDALRLANNKETRIQAQRQARLSLIRMTRLVEQLLLLARLDAPLPGGSASTDAAQVAGEVCRELAPGALAKGIELALQADPPNCLAWDADDLRILLRNLIDNAVRYGEPGGRVEVHLDGPGQRLWVRDSGPGIAAERRADLGRRFHRLGRTDANGSGLGLSIVVRLAERYGASVDFSEGLDGRGLAVCVRAPAGPA